MTQAQKDQIRRLYSKKYSYAEIGRIFGISRQRVHQIIKGYKSFKLSYSNIEFAFLSIYCGMCDERSTQIHHIDKNSLNNVAKNLLPLCEKCHKTIHRKVKQS